MDRMQVFKHCINILAVVLLSTAAFLFITYGLLYKNVEFIAVHFNILLLVSGLILGLLMVGGILFYALKMVSFYRLTICALVFIDIFSVVFFMLCATELLGKINSVDALREYIEGMGGMAAAIYIVFSFLQVVLLPVPGSISVAVGVAMFGPFKCAIYSFIGIV
ncbi:MAG: hypothetical protein K2K38_00595, partial [Clostridia bacterium]|nr:hypothetical protein [Clostridia bacterium]